MIPQIIQSTAVSGLVLSLVALVLAWLFGFDIRPMHVLARVFCRLPVPLRVLLMVLLVHVFVFASTKHDDPPPLTAPRPQQRTNLPRDAFGFTAAQFEAGFVYAGCATNEHWSFEAPEGAEEVADWRKRGAAYDWRRLVCTGMSTVVFSDGWLKSSVRDAANVFAPFGAPLGIVPEGGWPNLPSEAVPSRFWYGQGECGSRIYTWQNALLGRDTNASVSVQAEFFENGDFAYRYDLSQAGDLLSDPAFATNVVIGAWNAGHGETVPASNLTARLTSVLFRHLERRDVLSGDRDGDGLMTYDEIFSYHTDPDFVDTDGDGIPDGAEVAEGLDPLVRGFSDAEILLRVASSSTNEACLAEDKVLTNSLSAWKLWDGFAAFVPSGATNLVFERTFVLDRAEGWRQFYLSAKPDSAAGWTLQGLDLIWTDSAGTGGCVTRSPLGDSLYLPLPTNESSSVTIRLVATGGFVRSPGPVYLLAYDPKILIRGGSDVELDDGVLASVFTKGSKSEIALTVDRADRPCRAAYHPDELTMPGIADMADRSGGAFAYEGDEVSGMVVARGTGILDLPPIGQRKRIVVLNPSVGYEEEHDYVSRGLAFDENGKTYSPVYNYPIDGRCLWRNWNRTSGGARVCSCTPKASTGLGHEPDYVRMETLTDGENFHAEIRVGGLSVWSGDARHWRDWSAGSATESGSDLLTSLDECETCDVTCAGGVCDTFEGADIGSLEFRIPLGIPRKGQVSGFVHFRTETAVSVSPDIFDCTCRDDADVSVVTNGLSRRFVCGDRRGRDILIEPISDGVRITVRTASSQELEHVWEIVNVEGDSSVVRLRKISRLDNVMEDLTYVCDAGDWSETDNITGIRKEFFGSDGLNDPDDGLLSECRVTYDSTGRMVGDEFVNYARIGEGENAVLRETYYSSWNGGATVSRIADYWSDSHLARHGKLRLMSGNDRPWEYHDWDDFGRETLCVEQRNGSAVPLAFPTVISNALRNVSGLNDAFVTVYSYDPLVGDAEADVDFGCVRRMTRYVVRDGMATIIGCEWHRFTHLVRNGYPAVKNERIRGAASSYVITFDEDAAGVPLLLRGEIAEELDENGIRTENTYDVNGLTVTKTSRKFRGTAEFPIYEVSVLDAVYGNLLRSSVRMTADGALIGDEQSAYDDQNRLRSRSYLDGTSSTNAYSCCRLLWSRDREGRTTLRSAVTGQDRLYFADEETWMLEVVSNGYKVTQHFVDGFGRETNTVTFVGTVPGEANDWRVSEGRRIAETRFDYPWGGDGCEIALDSRGRRTTRTIRQYQDRDETVEVVSAEGLAQEMELTTTQTDYRNGRHETRRDWGGKWTVEAQETDYDAGGCEVSVETVRGSDCGCVTNSVTRHDMLGRVISVATPSGTTEYAYDGNSSRKISSVTTVDGFVRTTGYVYDAFGQAVGTVRDGLSVLHETGYERISNVWWRVARETVVGTVTNSVSETRERLTGLSDALRAQTVSVSPEGVVTDVRTSYDPATDLVTETTLSSVSSPFIRRLRHGKVIEMSSAEGMTSYAYDALGREVERCQDGRRTVVAYSAADDIASVTVFTNGIAGVTESYGYDHCGRRVSVTNALGEVTMTSYDGRDNVVAEEGVNGPVRFGYDARGRRISLSTTRNGTLFDVTEWTYDPVNASPTSKTYSDGSGRRLH